MCGIFGFNFNDKLLAQKMAQALNHRGPDHREIFEDDNLTLGYTRLSIIDLAGSNQPIFSEDKSLVLFFNGEIYNYKELRERLRLIGHRFATEGDCETIIHAYEEYGMDCVKHLVGMFSFAIYDAKSKNLFLARDRLGIKPLYFYHKNEIFIFASEIKAILEYKEIDRKVNVPAISDYLTYRYCTGSGTMLEGISKLLPGHYLAFDGSRHDIRKYWELKFETIGYDKNFYIDKFRALLKNSCEDVAMSDVPVGALLSGGIDSSSIVAMMPEASKIDTFTLGFDAGFENEFKYAKLVSEEFGTRHHEITIGPDAMKHMPKIIWHLDEPVADPTSLPNYILTKKASRYSKVLINGDGADELFCGYEQYKLMKYHNAYSHIPRIIRSGIYQATKLSKEPFFMKLKDFINPENGKEKTYHALISVFGQSEKKGLLNDKVMNKLDLKRPEQKLKTIFSHAHSDLNKMSYHDILTFLPDNMLLKYDKMTMASSVEGRVPFCDHRIAEFAASLPIDMKVRGMADKYIMRRAMKGILPEAILRKKKQRFLVPTNNWMNRGLVDYSKAVLDEKIDIAKEYFNDGYLDKLTGQKNFLSDSLLKMNSLTSLYYSRQLWTVTNFLIWHDIFIEGGDHDP